MSQGRFEERKQELERAVERLAEAVALPASDVTRDAVIKWE